MAEDGETKDDVKIPDGETGDKIRKLFTEEEKDTSMSRHLAEHYLTNIWIDVIVLTAMGEQLAIDAKEAPKG